jgi:pantetheine-phosphate adenylyltransferase
MIKGVYTGTFDVFTNGHLNIVERSLTFCDQIIIAIGVNSLKTTMFTVEERLEQINKVIDHLAARHNLPIYANVKVVSFQGLSVDFLKEEKANVIIRGIRNVSDFEYEINVANINKFLSPDIETIFLPTAPELASISSSMIKEVAKYGGDISKFAPANIVEAVNASFGFVKVNDKNTCRYMSCKNKCLPNLTMCKKHQPYPAAREK